METLGATTSVNTRHSLADSYLTHDLKGQRDWYSARASRYKQLTQLLALFVMAGGVTTGFMQIFSQQPWVPVATAAAGGLVALAEGWQRIARYAETWLAYRTAAEKMKRERRLFTNGAGAYRGVSDDEAFLLFVEAMETIIAEEQQTYWPQIKGPAETIGKSE